MEGDQIFDLAEVSRLCQPSPFTKGWQFSLHPRAFSTFTFPGEILHTDNASCALDAFNMATGLHNPITRSELEGDGMDLTATAPQVASALGEAPSLLSFFPLLHIDFLSRIRVEFLQSSTTRGLAASVG